MSNQLDMTYIRFYEKNPTVKQAVTTLFKFPAEIRSVLAKGMCAIAETDFNAHIRIQDLKSLGKDKVLALYKSQEKRRDYDTDPYLSKAMNYLMILEPPDQFFLAVKVNDLINVVSEFMILCHQHAQKIQLAVIERLTGTYVHCGLNEAEDLLHTIQHKFEQYFSHKKAQPPPEGSPNPENQPNAEPASLSFWESISTQGADMRLRLEGN